MKSGSSKKPWPKIVPLNARSVMIIMQCSFIDSARISRRQTLNVWQGIDEQSKRKKGRLLSLSLSPIA
jgi:hypothetical protein